MDSQRPDHRLRDVPWGAVVGELITALCWGCLGLFLPLGSWVSWPALLFSWHFAVVVIGALALALALGRRKPEALRMAIILAAYTGLPSLLSLSQALGQVRSPAEGLSYIVWGLGSLGQVAVVLSCLARLAPPQRVSSASPSAGVARWPDD
jgi:hypothetical protein